MKKTLYLFLLCGLIFACRSKQDYDAILSSWIGKSEAELVSQLGAPNSMENISKNEQIFVYDSKKIVNVPGEAPVFSSLGGQYGPDNYGDAFSEDMVYECQTIFTTRNDIIVDYSWQGDGCLIN